MCLIHNKWNASHKDMIAFNEQIEKLQKANLRSTAIGHSHRECFFIAIKAALYCKASIKDCLVSADMRGVFTDEWKKYIQKWFAMYQG